MTTAADLAESLESLRLEQDAILLYDGLAAIEKEPARATLFRTIAANERRHAEVWSAHVAALGAAIPAPSGKPSLRVRFILLNARLFGTRRVSQLVQALERDDLRIYAGRTAKAEASAIAVDEQAHLDAWTQIRNGAPPSVAEIATAIPEPDGLPPEARAAEAVARAEGVDSGGANTLRAVVFGASDGLVSNLSLIMGVAGANASPSFILLSGIAGLLAGAFSMAAGEYISVQSQIEILERQIALERAAMEAMPTESQAKLAGIYMAKGIPEADARAVAAHIFADRARALDTLVREGLGLDQDGLGNPWAAAAGSFFAFCAGAIVPVIPYLFGGGTVILVLAFVLSLVGLFTVGALVSLLTGRSMLFSGFRQVGIGAVAAIVTFLVGKVIGVAVG